MTSSVHKRDLAFIGTLVLVHVVFYLLAWHFTRIYMGDSFEYIYEALNIKRFFFFYSGNPAMPIIPEYMTQRQPIYPLFLLSVYLFSVNNWIVLVLQHLLSICNIFYMRQVIRKIGYRDKYDRWLLLLTIAYPAQFINASTIAPDILLQTCALVYFGNFVSLVQKKALRYAIYMSLSLVAGLLVKPVLYPFVVVHIIIIAGIALQQGMKLQRPALVALFPFCFVLMYNYWNYTRTGKFHFTSNQSFNAIYYFYPYLSHKEGPDSAGKFLRKERHDYDAIAEYRDRYDFANDQGLDLLKQNFVPYMAYHLQNSARIFIEPGKAEMDLFTGKLTYGHLYEKSPTAKNREGFYTRLKNDGWRSLPGYISDNPSMPFVIIVFLFNCLRLWGLIVFLLRRDIQFQVRGFVFVFVCYFAVASGPIANTRYFLPVSLIVIGCAATGLGGRKNIDPQPTVS